MRSSFLLFFALFFAQERSRNLPMLFLAQDLLGDTSVERESRSEVDIRLGCDEVMI